MLIELMFPALCLLLLRAVWLTWQTSASGRDRRGRWFKLVFALVLGGLVGQRFMHQLVRRHEMAVLVPEQVAGVEVSGRQLEEPGEITAVVRCLRDTQWATLGSHFRRPPTVPLVVTLKDGRVLHFEIFQDRKWPGTVLSFIRPSSGRGRWDDGAAFSSELGQVLASGGVTLP